MVLVLSVIGLVAAAWVWQNVNPLAGIVVGFLFVGGLGWRLLGASLGLLRPSARQAYGPEGRSFIAAWESRFGELRPGGMNHPPSGTFQQWLRANKTSGVSAADWLDEQMGLSPLPSSYLQPPRSRPAVPGVKEAAPSSSEQPGMPVTAVCEVLSYDGGDQRLKVLVADDRQLRITETAVMSRNDSGVVAVDEPAGSLFAALTWDDVIAWNQFVDDENGQPYWILTLKVGASVPDDVDGLDITSPTDESRWLELLRANVSKLPGPGVDG